MDRFTLKYKNATLIDLHGRAAEVLSAFTCGLLALGFVQLVVLLINGLDACVKSFFR
jgi:hypothetical protein